MLTQIVSLLARIERASSVTEGVTLLLESTRDQLASVRADVARRGDPTGDLDRALDNLSPTGIAMIALAVIAYTDAGDELVRVPDDEEAEPIVDPNTLPDPVVVPVPEPEAEPIVDPNTLPERAGLTLPADGVERMVELDGDRPPLADDDTPDGEFPTLKTYLAYGYLEANYEKEKAQFYASQERLRLANAGTEPGQGGASPPVLDVAPVGKTSDELNASGARPDTADAAPPHTTPDATGNPDDRR